MWPQNWLFVVETAKDGSFDATFWNCLIMAGIPRCNVAVVGVRKLSEKHAATPTQSRGAGGGCDTSQLLSNIGD